MAAARLGLRQATVRAKRLADSARMNLKHVPRVSRTSLMRFLSSSRLTISPASGLLAQLVQQRLGVLQF
jgi:hypothetical protein